MKLFKYKDFLKESNQDINSICEKWGIKNYTINGDGSIDVDGDVNLSNKILTKLPLKFRNVSGCFYCHSNQLTSLEGCPQSVGGNFSCSYNKLTSLEGSPKSVGGNFNCSYNQLTSLEGSLKSVGGYFYCHYNQLTSLEGGPKSVGGGFSCYDNQLTSLEGSPQSVGGNFSCHDNTNLISLEGFPLHYDETKNFSCENTKLKEVYELFDTIDAIEWINEFEVINYDSDVPEVYYMKLLDVWNELGQEPIPKEEINLKNYKLI